MPPKKHPTLWDAKPHTIAKIAILEGYLQAWFLILGRGASGQNLLYIDGFAGSGRYTNHPTGSPVAALRSAGTALAESGLDWKAGDVHCAFIEMDPARFAHLKEHIEPFRHNPRLHIHLLQSTFVDGIADLRERMPRSFSVSAPLFVFIDPFGATGAPFTTVANILSSSRSEVLFNFDADAVARIFRAGEDAGHERLLNDIFGDDSWHSMQSKELPFRELCRMALALYKARLRTLPNVRYVFSFEMSRTQGSLDYFLIFASQHPRGLEKMKQAMRRIDQDGEYRFSDAHVNTPALFRFDRPEDFAPRLFQHFAGQEVTYAEIVDFTLNETPFDNPKSMLRILEEQELIDVLSTNPKRRIRTFNEKTITLIVFRDEDSGG